MSNKIVPNIYRAVIDEVINSIKPEFEEYGVSEDVLADLQRKWEEKVIASNVAEFDTPPPPPPQPQHQAFPHPMQLMQSTTYALPYGQVPPAASLPNIKAEPVDNRYVLSNAPYTLPPLPGPQISVSRGPPQGHQQPGGHQGVLSFPPAAGQNGTSRSYTRIPQVDGPSGSDLDSPSPPSFAPRSHHPSLPQPQPQPVVKDEEAINSDLDDSDSEGEEDPEEGTAGETDIVFCTYDKVARVKNKWKCVLKDGMIHINGKDYLFQKCTGEFEW